MKMDVRDLGITRYEDALKLQKELLEERIAGRLPDTLIIVEHLPVVTLGRLSGEESIIDKNFFKKRNIPTIKAGRGGKITYHAPGQIVLYPILDLREKRKDVSFYIDFLEKTVAGSLNRIGVKAERSKDRRGVWVGRKKIAFIGIALKRWVTFHGVSANINNDVEPFSMMRPCGEADIKVTSAKEALCGEINMEEAKKIFIEQFVADLGVEYGITVAGTV